MLFTGALALGAAALVAASCAEIAAIPAGQCGNAVVDEGAEDCDLGSRFADQSACRAPGSDGECRFDCSVQGDGVATPCPPGYGCGADFICRLPSGQVEREGEADEDASVLVASDLDADGITDLVAQTSDGAVALYMRDDFDVDLDVDLVGLGSFATFDVTELTGDTYGDLAFTDIAGVGVLRGAEGRELVGTAFPTFTIPGVVGATVTFALDALQDEAGVEPLAVLQTQPNLSFVMLVDSISLAPNQLALLTPATAPFPALVDESGNRSLRDVPAGDLDPDTPCQEYVLAFRNTDEVYVGTPCTASGKLNGCLFEPDAGDPPPPVPIQPISIDLSGCGQAFSVDRAFVADVDLDGNDDIVITPEPGTAQRPACVVQGPLSFPPAVPGGGVPGCPWQGGAPIPPVAGVPFPTVTILATGPHPDDYILALDHLNDDSVIDIVGTLGIFLSRDTACPSIPRPLNPLAPGVLHCDVTPQSLEIQAPYFTSAATGNLNGTGARDVVMADGASGSLAAYLANPGDSFAAFAVETDGAADLVEVGDLDGDGVDDLVFADRPCADDSCESVDPDSGDALMVSFGRAVAGPEPPRNVGRLGRIQQIVTGRFRSPYATFDGTVDVGVLFASLGEDPVLTFATLYGSTERQLQAPFGLDSGVGPAETSPYLPLLVASGQLVEPDGSGGYRAAGAADVGAGLRSDLAVLAVNRTAGLELEDLSAAGLGLWLLATEGDAEMALSLVSEGLPEWAPDVDLRTLDIVSGDVDGDGADEVVVLGGHGFLVADVAASLAPGDSPFNTTPIQTAERFASRDLLERLIAGPSDASDAVGNPAALADVDGDGLADLVAIGKAPEGSFVLVVYFSTGGSFSADDKTVVPLVGRPHGFAVANIDQDLAPEIIVVGSDGVTLWRMVDHVFSAPAPLPGWLPGSDPPRSVAVGDFDVDGVPDLAFGSRSSTTFYRVLPGIE